MCEFELVNCLSVKDAQRSSLTPDQVDQLVFPQKFLTSAVIKPSVF